MKKLSIKINGKNFHLTFGMKVFLYLARQWKVNTIAEVLQRVQRIDHLTDACEIDILEIWADFVIASIRCNPENTYSNAYGLTPDDVILYLFENVAEFSKQFTEALVDAMPKNETSDEETETDPETEPEKKSS